MKKSLKISTMILASSMLISGGTAFLANGFNSQQNTSLLNYQYDAQTNNVQRAKSLSNINYSASQYSETKFAIIESADGDKLYGWGSNDNGQLGTGDTTGRDFPKLIQIPGLPSNAKITAISVGSNFTMLLVNNEIWVAGSNSFGQLGLGDDIEYVHVFTKNTHVNLSGMITSISAAGDHATAIVNNKLYGWGDNAFGQIGTGTSAAQVWEPIQITSPDWTSGTLSEAKNANNLSSVMYNDTLYIWGVNKFGTIGNGVEGGKVATPFKISLPGKITQFSLSETALALADGKLYGWGNGEHNQFNNGGENVTTPTIVNVPPGVIKSVWSADWYFMVQIDDKLYSVGYNETGQLGLGHNSDKSELNLVNNIQMQGDVTLLVSKYYCYAKINNSSYKWGRHTSFEEGTTVTHLAPTLSDTFGAASQTLTVKDPGNNKVITAANARKAFNPSGDSINRTEVAKYVNGIDSFPSSTIFSVKAGTSVVVDEESGTIILTITADRFFNEDGANVKTSTDFSLGMSGFLTISDSVVKNKTIPQKYNSNNIQSLLKGNGSVANNEVLNDLMDISFFPDNTTFEITDDEIDLVNKSYAGSLTVDKYFEGGQLISSSKVYPFNFTGLLVFSDSSVTEKTLTGDKYYEHNIIELLGTENANIENLKEVVNLIGFPDDAAYKIENPTVNNGTYTSNLIPSAYYLAGSLITNANGIKAFPIRVTGLMKVADSAITPKSVISDKYNLNNLGSFLGGDTLEETLHDVADVISFPDDTVFSRISGNGPDFDKGTFAFVIMVNKYHLDGSLVNAQKTFSITLSGLSGEIIPDSSVKEKTLTGNKYNLHNISDLLGTTNVNMDNLLEVVDLIGFPEGVTFTIENVSLDGMNGTYTSTLVASKYYYSNQLINAGGAFRIKITGLAWTEDSSVKAKIVDGKKYNLNNITDLLGTTTVNIANLTEVVELISFPDDATFVIRNVNLDFENGIYTSDLIPSVYHLNGEIVENTTAKTFPIKVSGLKIVLDSVVNQKTPTGTKYNLNNITDLLGTDTVNMTNLAEIAELAHFPTDVVFTIVNTKLDFTNGIYTGDLKPSKYFLGGFEIVNNANPAKTFEIKVSGLKGFKNSEVITKEIPDDIELENVQDKLKNADGNTVNRDVLGQLIDLTAFPQNTTFTADFTNSTIDENTGIFTLNMTANKQYIDGKAVDQAKDLELKLYFYGVPVTAPAADSTGLTVGLVIGGVILVLLLVGLYIWNKKRIQAAGGTPDGKDGKAKESKQARDLASTEVKTDDSIKIAKTEGSLDQTNIANPAQVNNHAPIEELPETKHSAEQTSSEVKIDKATKTSKTKSLSSNKTTNINKPRSNTQTTKKLNAKDDHKKSSQQSSSGAKNDKATKTSKTKSSSPNKTTNIDKPKSNPQATKKINASEGYKPKSVNKTKSIDKTKAKDSNKKA